ncbi:MAG: 2-C-methyl-D-erythritol 4-phosphate cytidylyltransferase [Draconibacterium sp.]|nr:MAG: 2-C-methyl-D-erythritol 4-phosphate cytidylyltransferase [Draconibacterium sp.]
MGTTTPKQFLDLCGKPVILHTLEAFFQFDNDINIILVLPENQFAKWQEICIKYNVTINHSLVPGGETRFQSVFNGLQKLKGNGIVFIHDGVRPLVAQQTLKNCFVMAQKNGNAIPVLPVTESVRMEENKKTHAVDRSKLFLVQTPQTFRISTIKEAYNQINTNNFTDDATVLEQSGEIIRMVDGNRENIKITYPADLLFAKAILTHR